MNEKIHENILIYDVWHKNPYDAKSLRNIFYKTGRYIRKHDRNKYLGLFYSDEKCERILMMILILIL